MNTKKITSVTLVFPHQLFRKNQFLHPGTIVFLVEEYLFFRQYNFHKQKIAFHRASMKFYENFLREKGIEVKYINAQEKQSDVRILIRNLASEGVKTITLIDPTDNWLMKRITKTSADLNIDLIVRENLLFLNSRKELHAFFKPNKKRFFQTSWYKAERVKRNILVEGNKPVGEKWSFDHENRKKYPAKKTPPPIQYPDLTSYHKEAKTYVEENFPHNQGELGPYPYYSIDFESTEKWMNHFLTERFAEFGTYEDAIVSENGILHHSVLTPMLNIGLIQPEEVLKQVLNYAMENNIPMNSTEGFVRQIIGWREFIRGMYEVKGSEMRTRNFWGFDRKIPASFYTGETGIPPVDQTIRKVLRTGYCHHIERLMILGNFMLLCEFDPDEVYRWFMELFIDAYDWVMVPNVYGMSQFADGGFFATKPYISGSNYLRKMSNYKSGEWEHVWDGLFWRFLHINRDFFNNNPRLAMLLSNLDRMNEEKRNDLLETAEKFLQKLH